MNTRSLRFRLLSWYVALLVASFAALGQCMHYAVSKYLEQNLKENLNRRARQIEHTAALSSVLSPEVLRDNIGNLYAPEIISRFVRVTKNGNEVLYRSGPPHDGSFSPDVPLAPDPFHESFRVEAKGSSQELLVKSHPISLPSGSVLIEVGAPLAPLKAVVYRVLWALLIGAPILIAVASYGAHKLIGRALSPVVSMARSAEDISLHNLNERLPVTSSGDELETLSTALNRMIERIHDAVEQNHRFVADASHELRTPLAVLRGELENVLRRTSTTERTREALESNLEEVERLGKIVEGLFALSRLDAGEAQNDSATLDLAELAMCTTEQMCLLAEDKNIFLVSDSPNPVWVRGDVARLKQVIVNLLDNAIKYTQAGGRVEVRVFTQDHRAVLQVKDNGIGIPRQDVEHIFERFYRVDKARSRDVGGAGLGLSIVKSICTAHGGDIEVESKEHAGSSFSVHLPLAVSQPILQV